MKSRKVIDCDQRTRKRGVRKVEQASPKIEYNFTKANLDEKGSKLDSAFDILFGEVEKARSCPQTSVYI